MLYRRSELIEQYRIEILTKQDPSNTLNALLNQDKEILQEIDQWMNNEKADHLPCLINLSFICPVVKSCNSYVGLLKEIEFIYAFKQSV